MINLKNEGQVSMNHLLALSVPELAAQILFEVGRSTGMVCTRRAIISAYIAKSLPVPEKDKVLDCGDELRVCLAALQAQATERSRMFYELFHLCPDADAWHRFAKPKQEAPAQEVHVTTPSF